MTVARLCRLAVLLAIVGTFGTWRTAGPVSLNGLEGPHNGWLVIIFGLIALAGVGALSRGSWLGIVTVAGSAAIMLGAPIQDFLDDRNVLGGRSGWGLWLTIAGAAVLGGAALYVALGRVRPRLVRS
jgi:hypothetical protein